MSDARPPPLPLLDRLLDEAGEPGGVRNGQRSSGFEAVRDAIRRDLEALLNARRRRLPLPARYPELVTSPLGYGLLDPTAGSFSDEESRLRVAREVEALLRRFEPRLSHVSVILVQAENDLDRTLRLRIEAVLRGDPTQETIGFETTLRPATLDVLVRQT